LYGKLGTYDLTQAAPEALTLIGDSCQRITFGIDFLAHYESVARAELGAVTTTFTSFFVNDNFTGFGSFDFSVKGFAP